MSTQLKGFEIKPDAAFTFPIPRQRLVPALDNAIAVINFLNQYEPHVASLSELSGKLKITKSHCHAILKTLVDAGWLHFDARSKTYRLHSGLIASASSLLSSPILARIRERLDRLTREIGYSGVLTQPQADDTFVVIENFIGMRSVEFSYSVGYHFPKDAPAQSRAYIAWQPAYRIARWLENLDPHRYTSASIVERASLEREIETTQQRGYSRSIGEHFESMTAFGLPIFDRDGHVIYVFCVMGAVREIETSEVTIARAMQQTIHDIHGAILGRPPAHFLNPSTPRKANPSS